MLSLEISGALLFKLAALVLLFVLFFGPKNRIDVTPQKAAQNILDTPVEMSGSP